MDDLFVNMENAYLALDRDCHAAIARMSVPSASERERRKRILERMQARFDAFKREQKR